MLALKLIFLYHAKVNLNATGEFFSPMQTHRNFRENTPEDVLSDRVLLGR